MDTIANSAAQTQTFNWGVAGPGHIAEKFAHDLAHVPGAHMHSVLSRAKGRADKFASLHGAAHAYDNADAFLADPALDIVYLATPHPAHFDFAMKALEFSKPILVEKPITMHAAQTRRLDEESRTRKLFVMEALWSRFLPAVREARDIIARGDIGAVRSAQATLAFYRPFDPEDRLYNADLGGGVLHDLGVYPLSVARFLLGPLALQTAQWRAAETGVVQSAELNLSFDAGPLSISTAFVHMQAGEGENAFVVFGEKGVLRIDRHFLAADTITLWDNSRRVVPSQRGFAGRLRHKFGLHSGKTLTFPRQTNGLNYQAEAVQDALASGRIQHPIMPLSESADVLSIIEKAADLSNRVP